MAKTGGRRDGLGTDRLREERGGGRQATTGLTQRLGNVGSSLGRESGGGTGLGDDSELSVRGNKGKGV